MLYSNRAACPSRFPDTHAHAIVIQALAIFRWRQDLPATEALCREALIFGPLMEPAVATLAQLVLQKSEIEVAITWFEKQVQMTRGEAEIPAALTYLEVCRDIHATTRRLTLGLG